MFGAGWPIHTEVDGLPFWASVTAGLFLIAVLILAAVAARFWRRRERSGRVVELDRTHRKAA